jgi:hypothetical protein
MSKRHIGKSYCTVTGLKVSRRVDRMVEFESLLERDLISILEFSPIVETFDEQPITIRWIDAGGKEHPYTPDFLIRFRGQRFLRKGSTAKPWLVEVKPHNRLAEQWDELRDRFRAAVAEASRRGWLFRILTDRQIKTPYLRNIAFLQCARNIDADETFRGRIVSLLKVETLTLALIPADWAPLISGRHEHGWSRKKPLDGRARESVDAGDRRGLSDQAAPSDESGPEGMRRICAGEGIRPPSHNTLRARIAAIAPAIRAQRRLGKEAAFRFEPHPYAFPAPQYPLEVVQIDHTKLDIYLVDEATRLPIGRPWITMAIDVFSRMVTGYYVSLDPPGDLSTGQCLARSILTKESWPVNMESNRSGRASV